MKLRDKFRLRRDVAEQVYCSSCGEVISKNAEICPECGAHTTVYEQKSRSVRGADEVYCFNCSAVVKKDAESCRSCGVRLAKSEVRPTADEMYCFSCGTIISRKAEVCPKCGVKAPALLGAKAGKNISRAADEVYCFSCGAAIKQSAAACTNCGVRLDNHIPTTVSTQAEPLRTERIRSVPVYGGKSKTMAVLLSIVPLGFWTWLYTYRRDGNKFIVSFLFLGIVALIATVLTLIDGMPVWSRDLMAVYESAPLSVAGMAGAAIAGLLIWIWALMDVSSKSVDWYLNYH